MLKYAFALCANGSEMLARSDHDAVFGRCMHDIPKVVTRDGTVGLWKNEKLLVKSASSNMTTKKICFHYRILQYNIVLFVYIKLNAMCDKSHSKLKSKKKFKSTITGYVVYPLIVYTCIIKFCSLRVPCTR